VYLAATAIAKIAGAITAAIIGLVGTLMAAILNHANQLDAQRKQAAFTARQDNYKELLSKVGAFARAGSNYTEAGDDLSSAHLASWAFGDQKVLPADGKRGCGQVSSLLLGAHACCVAPRVEIRPSDPRLAT
jgi:hypothetical protein